jgi:hypothetical protein
MAIALVNKYDTVNFGTGGGSGVQSLTPTVAIGNVLVLVAANDNANATQTFTVSGTGLVVTGRQLLVDATNSAFNNTSLWTATITAGGTPSVSCTSNTNLVNYGFAIYVFSGVGAVGTSTSATPSSTGALSITTGATNSCVVVVLNDFNGVSTARTYLTTAGAVAVDTTMSDSSSATLDGAHYLSVGAAGTKSVGVSAPTGRTWTMAAVELQPLGIAPLSLLVNKALRRSTVY